MKIYKLTTVTNSVYWTVAETLQEAEHEVLEVLKNAKYGHSMDNSIKNIEIIAENYLYAKTGVLVIKGNTRGLETKI